MHGVGSANRRLAGQWLAERRITEAVTFAGPYTQRQAPALRRIYEQMCEPKWVVAFGVCASSGGFYDNYAVLQGIDRFEGR